MLDCTKAKILKPENYYVRNKVKSGPCSQPMFFCQQGSSLGALKNFREQRKQGAKGKKTLLKIHT
jgi:hypothetical protein